MKRMDDPVGEEKGREKEMEEGKIEVGDDGGVGTYGKGGRCEFGELTSRNNNSQNQSRT